MSYHSQYWQDELLDTTLFEGLTGGRFLDIGACDGVLLSNSLFFEAERHWSGICVEADPSVFPLLAAARPAALCLNVAAGSTDGTLPFIQMSGPNQMLSGLASSLDEARVELEVARHGGTRNIIEVPVVGVDRLLADHGVEEIHYLSLDIEGGEAEVLRSVDFGKVMVHAMTVECNHAQDVAEVTRITKTDFVVAGYLFCDLYLVNRKSPFLFRVPALTAAINVRNRPNRLLPRALRKVARLAGRLTGGRQTPRN